MTRKRLRPGEGIAGVCAVALLVVMFLPWYEIGGSLPPSLRQTIRSISAASGVDLTRNAWQSFAVLDVVMLLAILAAVGLLVLALTQRSVALPVAASVIVTALGALATLLVLYRLINEPGFTIGGGGGVPATHVPDRVIDIRFWAFAGFALCAGITLGGFLAMADEGQELAQVEAQPMPERRPAPAPGVAERE
jgi:hypothetical protein